MKMLIASAAALAALATTASAQVPSYESMYGGTAPPRFEGRVASTPSSNSVNPDDLAPHGPVYARTAPRYYEGKVASTTRMNAITPDSREWRMARGRAWVDEDVVTGTVVRSRRAYPMTGTAMVATSGPSMEWKWQQCTKLYPSFDPRTGTFIGEDGLEHLCQ